MGPGGGQVEVGQWAGVGDEDGIEGAGLVAPGDGDVVSGGFAEAVQVFGDGGVGGVLGERVCQGQPGGEGLFDVDIGDQSGAGYVGDAHGGGTFGYQSGVQSAQACALGPGPGERGGHGAYRCWSFVDGDVIAVPGQFVVGPSAFDLDVESGHRRTARGPGGEKPWGQ
ncbi:hypothetical protein LAUMK35_05669 [Mycobacterium pseudokansasii]|nr:hypothetical protein LAUMK35_05669 [Mycobacterium pseudokansasii]VBA35670.1 hypothetical protein LAUMK21_05654 [Mycobacterium pseudokansasii]